MIIGIDPGAQGAAVLMFSTLTTDRCIEIIRFKTSSLREIADKLWEWSLITKKAYLESVHSMPTDGRATAHQFGRNVGFVEGVLTANRFDINYIDPKTWQFALGLGGRGGAFYETRQEATAARKRRHREKAEGLFPQIKMTNDIVDALLIAEFGLRCS